MEGVVVVESRVDRRLSIQPKAGERKEKEEEKRKGKAKRKEKEKEQKKKERLVNTVGFCFYFTCFVFGTVRLL